MQVFVAQKSTVVVLLAMLAMAFMFWDRSGTNTNTSTPSNIIGASRQLRLPDPKSVSLRLDDNDNDNKKDVDEFVIVTGSSENHIKFLEIDLLASIKKVILNNRAAFPFDVKVIFYDLDIDPELQAKHEQMIKSYTFVEYRKFDYASYPDFFDIRVAIGEYAWKGTIIEEVVREQRNKATRKIVANANGGKRSPSFVYWIDAGLKLNPDCNPPLSVDIAYASETGIFTPKSQGSLSYYTDNRTANYLNLPQDIYKANGSRMCSGGIVLVDINNDKVYEDIILPWAECAKIKECIAPEGSFKRIYHPEGGFTDGRHRQDQSVLSVLLAKHGHGIHQWTSCIRRGHG